MSEFTTGQKVQYKAHVKIGRPDAWDGELTFIRYTGTMDGCLISNDGSLECGMYDYASTLEPTDDTEATE